ncbi:CRISPR-associated protein Cas5t [Oikeobacillus pervagus]|uniref:CRISPR-associated protein Cas5t n=1 Tax=Oikeobacillus pervagus TaxID=1325931 RepID=A0AAJ1WJL7_9BACI|nr:type I-B CRISPR-associated protein Cas5b [Oikeobacillus pervagus]MDQ0215613.1 CRISPR-associated protein Cas5t [Oikeobacillus pervagus]
MRLLRIKIFQETACYQKPLAFKVGETYPLAPFSTVKGMLHAVLNATEYIPMNLSIQGTYESMMIDYVKKYMYKKANVQFPFSVAGLGMDIEPENVTSMPMYLHLLYNIEHVIHIDAETKILDDLYRRLSETNQTLSLGRWEDLVRIDEIEFVEMKEQGNVTIPYDCYIPTEWAETRRELKSDTIAKMYFRLPRKYEIIRGKRVWDHISTVYLPMNRETEFTKVIPHDGCYPIFLMEG